MDARVSLPPDAPEGEPAIVASVAWLLPGKAPHPAEALQRIQALCRALPDPYTAVITVLVTHPSVPWDLLAPTLQRFRPDLAGYAREDMVALLTAAWNGGKSGFDAVMRTRANAPKRTGGFSWVKE